MTVSYADLPSLLHDASLAELHWDRSLAELRLEFADGLRTTQSGQEHEHATLLLTGVRAIAAYEPLPRLIDGKKPESDRPLLTEQDLSWTKSGGAWFKLNSRRCQFELESTDRRQWLCGSAEEANAGRFNIFMATIKGHLYVSCDSIECQSSGNQLSLDTWSEECGQWWDAWKQYWESGDDGNTRFDNAISIAPDEPSDAPADLPNQPACVLDSDAPAELLAPIRDYHEGHIEGDWARMSRGWPDFDQSPESQATNMQSRYKAGPWVYPRQVDSWWIDGAMAYVELRGVEHQHDPREGLPQNLETVIGYELRRFKNGWIIWNLSQGWVRYGSASALPEPQPWHDEWDLENTERSAVNTSSSDRPSETSGPMPLPNDGRSPETAKIAAAALISIGITIALLVGLFLLAVL